MTETAAPLHLEDLAVGQRFTSPSHTMEAEEIKAFAAAYDPQPFHLDEAAADASFFRGLAASGWHTAAVTMRLLVEGGAPLANGIIGAGSEVTWPRATRPGDVLTAVTEIVEIKPSRSRPERGLVTLRTETLNQRGEVVQVMTSRVVVWQRGARRIAALTTQNGRRAWHRPLDPFSHREAETAQRLET